MNQTIQILLNGETYPLSPPFTLETLLDKLKISSPYFAIVKNGEIVPRSLINQTTLKESDVVEMIRAVAGG